VPAGASVAAGRGTGTVVLASGVMPDGAVTAGGVVLAGGMVLALGEVTADAVPDGAGVWEEEVAEQADKAPAARRLQQVTRIDFTRMTRILLRGRR